MRFLHTGDWHVGKTLRGRSRLDEQEQVIGEILDIACRQRIDCVLLAGDIFDSSAPPPDGERLVYNFFAELVGRGIDAVVIGGNHDHPRRLGALRALLDPLKIHIRPEPEGPEQGAIVTITRNGERARVAALPWISERKLVSVADLLGGERDWQQKYAGAVAGMANLLAQAAFSADTVNIVAAHLHVDGAITGDSERSLHITPQFAVDAALFPAAAHYVALGHIHKPQPVIASPAPCAYSGSTLQLDFGERGQTKRVVIVDAAAGRKAAVESIALTAGRQLIDVAGTLSELRKAALLFLNDYLRVTLEVRSASPGLAQEVRQLFPNAVEIRIRALETEPGPPPSPLPAGDSLAPVDLFEAFHRSENESPLPGEFRKAFLQIYDEVTHAPDAPGA